MTASRSVGRSNSAGSCPVFTPSKDANDGRVAFSDGPKVKAKVTKVKAKEAEKAATPGAVFV